MHIGFIGLGQMGRGMASRLLEAGHTLTVWNRSPGPARTLEALGARVAARAGQTLDTELVVSMLADDAAVRAVWLDDGLVTALASDRVHLNMATVGLDLARELERSHADRGSLYVSAPVFGRPELAARGELDIVAAGPEQALTLCRPLFQVLGRRTFELGAEAAHANIVKIARNFVLATIIESLGEAFALVERGGVEPRRFLDVITATSMSAPAYKNYGRLMLERPDEPTFPLRLGLKDVELALAAAALMRIPLPSAALIRDQHLGALAHGYGDKDWAELGNWIARCAGIDRG